MLVNTSCWQKAQVCFKESQVKRYHQDRQAKGRRF